MLSTKAAASGHGTATLVAGMASAAAVGVGLGSMLPMAWIDTGTQGDAKDRADQSATPARIMTVYEDVQDLADGLKRPEMIRDAVRTEVESLYEFKTCLASGGSGSVWRAVERSSGNPVAIKVIDKKLLHRSLLHMEVYAMQRCAGHPNIVQLLAAYDVAADELNPEGEWPLAI